MTKTIQELTKTIHDTAKAKGWWEKPRESGTIHMLIVSEIAEATEEARKGTPPVYQIGSHQAIVTPDSLNWGQALKPEGELTELADAVIRIMDYCGHKGWDLQKAIEMKMAYNDTRSHRHGGKAF